MTIQPVVTRRSSEAAPRRLRTHKRPPARQASRRRPQRVQWAYLAAPLALLAVFTYIPVASLISYSFTDWDGLSRGSDNIGFENYADLFTRPEFLSVFTVSLYYLAGALLQIGLALYFATVLCFDVRLGNLFKGILFFPYLLNGVAIGFVFLYFFQPGGTLDAVLGTLGVSERQWLGDPDLVNSSLAGVSVWRYMGINLVLFTGAIQSIPPALFEAAVLDGASRWHQFRHVIAPSIKPIISISVILAVSGALSVFEIPLIMTGGANNSETFVIQTLKLAFNFDKVGLASAGAVVLLVLVVLVTYLQRLLVPDDRVELS
ncbi:carbohydrate ABC transporter permease [Streptomyces sp. NPDC060194]|uniref:carbohydrate ABC transporter permease n=1 Tax=Streptomyces sp. NPDC060194 TaxID=3347069 RepID=UPI0036609DA3